MVNVWNKVYKLYGQLWQCGLLLEQVIYVVFLGRGCIVILCFDFKFV